MRSGRGMGSRCPVTRILSSCRCASGCRRCCVVGITWTLFDYLMKCHVRKATCGLRCAARSRFSAEVPDFQSFVSGDLPRKAWLRELQISRHNGEKPKISAASTSRQPPRKCCLGRFRKPIARAIVKHMQSGKAKTEQNRSCFPSRIIQPRKTGRVKKEQGHTPTSLCRSSDRPFSTRPKPRDQ
jgi:hypothetical protein